MDGAGRRQGWGYPPSRPFILLTAYFVVTALQVAVVAARPPLPSTPVGALWVIAGASMVLAAAVVVAWLRWASVVLPVLVMLGLLPATASVAVSAGGQGQLVAGFYLVVLGVFTGYFLSARTVRVFAVLAVLGFGLAFLSNPILDSTAYAVAVIGVGVGMSLVVSSLADQLRSDAVHDPLTGAKNRRGLEHCAMLIHALDARHEVPTAIVEIDLDGFKHYNDVYGHQAGDDLLASVVHDWSQELRRTDLLARTGGDEFVLVLSGTGRDETDALLMRLRAANPAPWSAGVVMWGQGEPFPHALHEADTDMYAHKRLRRS